MRFDIITIFPEIFRGVFEFGIIRRAIEAGLIEIAVNDLRNYTDGRHRQVDDRPFGGGAGMVMKPEPLFRAAEGLTEGEIEPAIVLLSPQGRVFDQSIALDYASRPHVVLICGRYEGVDERVVEHLVTDEVSIGDYILSGGEIPAMVFVDAVTRLIPGALGDAESAEQESFTTGLLDYPHYTRPAEFRGMSAPEVLTNGNHAEIERWRREKAIEKTLKRRPDLIRAASLSKSQGIAIQKAGDESENET